MNVASIHWMGFRSDSTMFGFIITIKISISRRLLITLPHSSRNDLECNLVGEVIRFCVNWLCGLQIEGFFCFSNYRPPFSCLLRFACCRADHLPVRINDAWGVLCQWGVTQKEIPAQPSTRDTRDSSVTTGASRTGTFCRHSRRSCRQNQQSLQCGQLHWWAVSHVSRCLVGDQSCRRSNLFHWLAVNDCNSLSLWMCLQCRRVSPCLASLFVLLSLTLFAMLQKLFCITPPWYKQTQSADVFRRKYKQSVN